MPTDFSKSEPVVLYAESGDEANFALFKPNGELNHLPAGSKLLLMCPGRNNAIELLNVETVKLVCQADGTFVKSGTSQTYKLKQLGCKAIPTSTLHLTAERCAHEQGYIFEAGFEFNDNKFAPVFSICYDNVTEHIFYTRNNINGATIDYKIIESTRRAFRADGMSFTTTATNNYYTINNQVARFEQHFGANQKYINNTMFMARGHLSPDADFIFSYEQLATYFYANVAPEFQCVNAGNWLRVENLARRLASQYAGDLDTYTGVMGKAYLSDAHVSSPVLIALDEAEIFPAPEFYFKVIKHEPSDAAVVMISSNNPFLNAAQVNEFCTNVCERAGLQNEIFKDIARGYTFCCELSEFKQHYADLPEELQASKLLGEPDEESNEQPVEEEVEEEEEEEEEEDEENSAEPIEHDGEGCLIHLPSDIPSAEPVYFVSATANAKPQLLQPTGEFTELPIGAVLTLHCAGAGNSLEHVGQSILALTCQAGNSLYSEQLQQSFTLDLLNCVRIPTSEVLSSSQKCGSERGYILQAGFPLGANFGSVFDICYDNNTEKLIYTRNIINGATLNYKVNDGTKRAYRANGMKLTTAKTNTYYTINSQIARFEHYFGAQQSYLNNSMYLARFQLSSDADFIFSYEPMATFFYANVAPVFQAINAGNWRNVENIARNFAQTFETDLLVFNGVLDTLQLKDSANALKKIHLDDTQLLAAPKWIYKIMLHSELDTGLVLITLNNPFAAAADIVEFCSNVCVEYNIDTPVFKDRRRGYTFCCTFDDFKNSVNNLPTFDLPENWN